MPFAYRIKRREVSGNVDAYRPSVIFYDGMGRKIQTQEETVDGAQMRVTDTVFDGLDRATAQSIPRHVNTSPATFGDFVTTPTVICGTGAWSCTTYDALGRQKLVTGPDGNTTDYQYGVESAGLMTVVTDANGHRKKNVTDMLSRLKSVSDYTGTGIPYALYASTTYNYNALDLLTKVTDDADNETVLTYDSAGRKTTIKDPDMGSWAYTYDVAGNLVAQTDAKAQTMLFGYDDLNRLTSKLSATYTGFSESFGSKNTDWTWTTYQTVVGSGDTQIRNTGTGSSGWEATFYRPYTLSNREGVQINFKLNAANTDALFALEANDPDPYFSANHPRFAVEATNNTLRVQSTDGSGTWRYVPLMEDTVVGQWYVLTMSIDDNGGFTAHVYPKGQPQNAKAHRVLLPNARNLQWRFRNDVRNNSVDLDDYREYNGAGYRYDEGTNGKGQRTTMISPGTSNSWSYDSRGRMTTANFVQSSLSWSIQTGYDAADRVTALTYPSGETVNYTYDAGWRQASLCSATYSVCYANNTTFDALDQPESWQLGNGLWSNWVYTAQTRRVYALKVGTAAGDGSASGAHLWYRYAYDDVGNVATIKEFNGSGVERETQTFGYDHLDRLVSASAGGFAGGPASYSRTYTYDTIGNLLSKDGRTYSYPASGPTSVRPHAATCANVTGGTCATNEAYAYDAVGNVTSGGGRTFTWSAENQPLTIVKMGTGGVTEDSLYNADNERVKLTTTTAPTKTVTFYQGGMAEDILVTVSGSTVSSTKRNTYTFNGQVIAQRDVTGSTSTFRYLHGDHLGSVSAVSTSGSSPTVTRQYFTPWGEERLGNLTATTDRNYTGQRKDDTGLLFYNARYYDAKLGRFLSADSIVPGSSSGKGGMGSIGADGGAATTLTVDFHEEQFALAAGAENAFTREKGFGFESDEKGKYQGGPSNLQALNRYSYVLNNPLRYTDPTGHAIFGGNEDAGYASSCSDGAGKPVVDCDGEEHNKEVRKGCDKNGENCTHRMVHIWYVDKNGVRHDKWVWDNLKDSNDPFDEFKMYADKLPSLWGDVMKASGGYIVAGGFAAIGCWTGIGCIAAGITWIASSVAVQYYLGIYEKARDDAVRAGATVPSA